MKRPMTAVTYVTHRWVTVSVAGAFGDLVCRKLLQLAVGNGYRKESLQVLGEKEESHVLKQLPSASENLTHAKILIKIVTRPIHNPYCYSPRRLVLFLVRFHTMHRWCLYTLALIYLGVVLSGHLRRRQASFGPQRSKIGYFQVFKINPENCLNLASTQEISVLAPNCLHCVDFSVFQFSV